MFNLKKPCADCPFIKGGVMNESLSEGRMEVIVEDLYKNHTFHCHKTIDYDNDFAEDEHGNSEFNPSGSNQFCAGAMLYLEREGRETQMMQVAERLGFRKRLNEKYYDQIIDRLEVKIRY